MYQYTICNQPDEDIFRRQCEALERKISGIVKVSELTDVDTSKTCIYEKSGARITIKNDCYIGGVFVDSEIELTQFFKD